MKRHIALAALLLTGCAGAKLEKQQREIEDLNAKAGSLLGQLKDRADEVEALKASKAELEGRVTELEGKLAVANARVDSLQKSNNDLSSALKAGKDAVAAKLNDAIAEKDEAALKLSEALKEKLALERLKNIYKSARDKASTDLAELQKERGRLIARLSKLDAAAGQDAAAAQKAEEARSAARAAVREEMGAAADAVLKELQSGKAAVDQDGEASTVTLQDSLVFEEGSAKITEAGAARLDRLAKSLKPLAGKRVRVEAHSDNAPFKKGLLGGYDGHWELSAARAAAAARWLHEHGGLDPASLESAGYGEFRPAKSNATPEGRAANRRLALVVSPR
jgi:chemotaxis protein MotB